MISELNTEAIKVQTKPQVSYMTNAAVPPNFSSAERKEIIVFKMANFTFTLTLDNQSYQYQ